MAHPLNKHWKSSWTKSDFKWNDDKKCYERIVGNLIKEYFLGDRLLIFHTYAIKWYEVNVDIFPVKESGTSLSDELEAVKWIQEAQYKEYGHKLWSTIE